LPRDGLELFDAGSFRPGADGLASTDPLDFPSYAQTREKAATASGTDESVVAGPATITGIDVELALFSFGFIGGSMGEVAGERLARALERAGERGVPFLLYTASGGARMQEGMVSLIQMTKVVAARSGLARAHVPFLAVLGNPTTGGVLASIAALADVTVAEVGATIGFTGPSVAEQFLGRPLAGTSHTAEITRASGLVDDIVDPGRVRDFLAHALAVLAPDAPQEVEAPSIATDVSDDPDAWEVVQRARAESRPRAPELLAAMLDSYIGLRGDRAGRDDAALGAALARIAGRRAVILALDRAHPPGPGAYRKARRCLDIAARLDLPVVTVVDTRGANPTEGSETGGIAWEIAALFEAMLEAPVPIISVVTGEGGSGGALAFATADVLLAYPDSFFSVIGPEAAAAILWRDPSRAAEAARLLRVAAHDLVRLGIADALVNEPLTADSLRRVVAYHLARLDNVDPGARRDRWRNRGPRQETP
jgi:acetyl-CoA carboxylase carboxyl transferase subunit beta